MSTQAQPRWGILALAVAMMFLNLLSNAILGQKGSLYIVFWGYIAYLAYKGDIDTIFQWVKWVLIINVVVGLGFSLFADDHMMGWVGFGSVEEFLIGLGIPVAIKGGLLLYLNGQRTDTSARSDLNQSSNQPTAKVTAVGAVNRIALQKRVEDMESAYAGVYQTDSLAEDPGSSQKPRAQKPLEPEVVDPPVAVELSAEDEENAYETAGEEVDSGRYRKGLWTKLWAENDGDEKKVKLLYIRARVEQILADTKKSREAELRLAEEARKKAIAAERHQQELERLRIEKGQAAAERLQITGMLEDAQRRQAIESSYSAALRVKESTEEKIRLLRLIGGDLQWDASKSKEAGSVVNFAGDSYRFDTLYEFCDWFDERILKEVGIALTGQ